MLICLDALIQQLIVTSTSATSPLEPSRRRWHLRSHQQLNSWRITLLRSVRSSIQTRLPKSYKYICLMYCQHVKLINPHQNHFLFDFFCVSKSRVLLKYSFFMYPLYFKFVFCYFILFLLMLIIE